MTIRPDPPVDPPVNLILIAAEEPSVTDLESYMDSSTAPPSLLLQQQQRKSTRDKKTSKKKKKRKSNSASSGSRKSSSKKSSSTTTSNTITTSLPLVKNDGKPMGIVEEVARVLNMYHTSDDEDDNASARRRNSRRRRERVPIPTRSVLKRTGSSRSNLSQQPPPPATLDQFFREENLFEGLVHHRAATGGAVISPANHGAAYANHPLPTEYELDDLETRSQASKGSQFSSFLENNSTVREILNHLFYNETKVSGKSSKMRRRFSIKALEDEELPVSGSMYANDNMSLFGDGRGSVGGGGESVGNQSMPALGGNWDAKPSWLGMPRRTVPPSRAVVSPIPKALVIEANNVRSTTTREGHMQSPIVVKQGNIPSMGTSKSSGGVTAQNGNKSCTEQKSYVRNRAIPAPGVFWEAGVAASSLRDGSRPQSSASVTQLPSSIVFQVKSSDSTNQHQVDPSKERPDSPLVPRTQQGGIPAKETEVVSELQPAKKETKQVPLEQPFPRRSVTEDAQKEDPVKTAWKDETPPSLLPKSNMTEDAPKEDIVKTARKQEAPQSLLAKSSISSAKETPQSLLPKSSVSEKEVTLPPLLPKSSTSTATKKLRRSTISAVFGISLSNLRDESLELQPTGVRRNSMFGFMLGPNEVAPSPESHEKNESTVNPLDCKQSRRQDRSDDVIKKIPEETIPTSGEPTTFASVPLNASEPVTSASATPSKLNASLESDESDNDVKTRSSSSPQANVPHPTNAVDDTFDGLADEDDLDQYIESLVARELNTRALTGEVKGYKEDALHDDASSHKSASASVLSEGESVDEMDNTFLDEGICDDPLIALQVSINEHLEALKDGLDKTPRNKHDLGGWFGRNSDRVKVLSSVEDRSNFGEIESVEGYSLQESLRGRRSGRFQRANCGGDNDLLSVDEIDPVEDDQYFSDGSSSHGSYSDQDDPEPTDLAEVENDNRARPRNSEAASVNSEDSPSDEGEEDHSGVNPESAGDGDKGDVPREEENNIPLANDVGHHDDSKEPSSIAIETEDSTESLHQSDTTPRPDDNTAVAQIRAEIVAQEKQAVAIGPIDESPLPVDLKQETFQPREIKTVDEKPLQLNLDADGTVGDTEQFKDFPRHDGTAFFRYRAQEWKESTIKSNARKVSFDKIIIREHNLCPGDNPACSDSLPISLDWDHGAVRVWAIDDFEKVKYMFPIPEDAEGMARRLSWMERRELLMEVGGYTDRDIQLAENSFKKMIDDDSKKLEETKPAGFFSRLFSSSKKSKPESMKQDESVDDSRHIRQETVGESSAETSR